MGVQADAETGGRRERCEGGGDGSGAVAAQEFGSGVKPARLLEAKRTVGEQMVDIGCERFGGGETPGGIPAEAAGNDAPGVATQLPAQASRIGAARGGDAGLTFRGQDREQTCRRRWRFLQNPAGGVQGRGGGGGGVACFETGKQFKQDQTQGIKIGAGIDLAGAIAELLRTHVSGRADEAPSQGEAGVLGVFQGAGDAEVDDLGHGVGGVSGDKEVGGFQVPVNDAPEMGMMDGAADGGEEAQAGGKCQLVVVAEGGDRFAAHQFHGKPEAAARVHAGIIQLGDVVMLHFCQGALLAAEALDGLHGVGGGRQHFQRDLAVHRGLLPRQIDDPAAAASEFAGDFVRADAVAGLKATGLGQGFAFLAEGGGGKEPTTGAAGLEESRDGVLQHRISVAFIRQESGAFRFRKGEGGVEQGADPLGRGGGHGKRREKVRTGG